MKTDVCVVGGGIVGLATAYRLLEARPGLQVTLLEKEQSLAAHQTTHNSGVLHAGVYYAPGSMKARLSRTGKAELEAFAADHGIPVVRNGKVIVAVEDSELERFEALKHRALANGVEGLREIDADELATIEPAARGLRALHSPTTAVVDFGRVADALANEIRDRGGQIHCDAEVVDLSESDRDAQLVSRAGYVGARVALVCAGLQSDRLARRSGHGGDLRIIPFRGSYLQLRPSASHLVRGNIYPVPDPRFPFLGVHFTRRSDGAVLAGPNAVLAGGREAYSRNAVSWRDLAQVVSFPGFWRMAAQHAKTGAREVLDDRLRGRYVRQLQRYVPALEESDLVEGPTGIRAQAVRADGTLVDDFSIGGSRRLLHVRNAPSPAATASLAIGRMLTAQLLERLDATAG